MADASWARLDNAAKIFPSTSSLKDPKVFRFSCSLFSPVDGALLQTALDKTLEDFPQFLRILRRGLFWYYFEETSMRPKVRQEDRFPCSVIYQRNKKSLLFDVTYYKKRINFEVYHSLTDGTGALEFIKSLAANYIALSAKDKTLEPPYSASEKAKDSDSFNKYYTGAALSAESAKIKRACRVSGRRFSGRKFRIIEGLTPMRAVRDAAKKYDATVSAYITAALISAIGEELSMLKKRRPVIISVPVNLRRFFASETARNFFSRFSVEYDFSSNDAAFESIIEKVKEEYKNGLDVKKLENRLNSLMTFEKNAAIRVLPLLLKDMTLNAINKTIALGITATISNIGVVDMPKGFEKHIEYFSVFISPSMPQICVCSYGGVLSVGFTSPFVSPEIEKNFFRKLSADGIEIELNYKLPNRE